MKNKKRNIFIMMIVILNLVSIIAMPSIRFKVNQSNNSSYIEKVREHAISSNVMIVQENYKQEENVSANSISAGASGAIFKKEGNKYFALTAYHVIENRENADSTNIIIMGYDDLSFKDYLNKDGKYQGISNYYQQFPKGIIEYADEKYDLAVISFYSDEDYKVLSISDKSPEYGDIVAIISNPYGKRNVITAGKVVSRKPKPFGDEDGKMQHPVIKHTALISEGSSGSALLNKDLEIVGINLGGNENLFRQHISGMAMPMNRIVDFLDAWENQIFGGE
jgi:S1-C subfamily serine protease